MDANGWISTKDALPQKDGRYLVQFRLPNHTDTKDEIYIFGFNIEDVAWECDAFWVTPEVVAWQPLPEFYKSPDLPKPGDQGVFDGERWMNIGSEDFITTSYPKVNIPINFEFMKSEKSEDRIFINNIYTKEEAESRWKLLKEVYDDLEGLSDEIEGDDTYWTSDKINYQISHYLKKLELIMDSGRLARFYRQNIDDKTDSAFETVGEVVRDKIDRLRYANEQKASQNLEDALCLINTTDYVSEVPNEDNKIYGNS